MTIEKGSKVKASNTCKTVTIKMNCEGYPEGVPLFNMSKSPETWKVRQGKRGGVDTDNLRQLLARQIKRKEKLIISINEIIEHRILSNKGIKNKVNAIHHGRPTWAGGLDIGWNLVQLNHEQHTEVHRWMRKKLSQASDDLRKALENCDNKKNGGNVHPTPRLDCMKTDSGNIRSLSESNITTIAEKLAGLNPPITLKIEMTCDCAVSKSNKEIF